MIDESNLATAHIAKIFGSELLKVQESSINDQRAVPHIVKIDPKQFLIGTQSYNEQRKNEEKELLKKLQMEAEAAFPSVPPQQQTSVSSPTQNIFTENAKDPYPGGQPVRETQSSVLEKIAHSLERIANAVDKVEIISKKRKVKKNISYKKPKINEANS